MCFSVNVNLVKEEIEDRYGVNFPDKYRYEPSYYYQAFALPEIPAICSDDPGNARLLKWGLIPSWVKSETIILIFFQIKKMHNTCQGLL